MIEHALPQVLRSRRALARDTLRLDAPRQVRPDRLQLSAVTSAAALKSLKPAWDLVFSASETATPFLSHEWVTSWWESFGTHQELYVLVVEDELGPAAIAPLARAHRAVGPWRYRALEILGTGRLRFLGMGLANRTDFLLARRRDECLEKIVRHLAAERRHWDVVDLRFIPEESTTARRLADLARLAGLGHARERCAESPYVTLAGSYEDYLAQRRGTSRRSLQRKACHLAARGEVRWDLAAEQDASRAFEACIVTSRGSWKAEEGSALLLHPGVREFWRRLAPRLAATGGLYVALATVGGKSAAHELGFRMDGKLWAYDSAYQREFAHASPGTQLTAKLLEGAWASGLSEYDFMRGKEAYKRTWETGVRAETQIVLDSGSVRARAARALAYDAKWALKRRPLLLRAQRRAAGLINKMVLGQC